jgi:hypothetical protein
MANKGKIVKEIIGGLIIIVTFVLILVYFYQIILLKMI